MNGAASWQAKVLSAVLVLVVVAFGARVAASLLQPLLPTILVLAGLLWLFGLLLGRGRR